MKAQLRRRRMSSVLLWIRPLVSAFLPSTHKMDDHTVCVGWARAASYPARTRAPPQRRTRGQDEDKEEEEGAVAEAEEEEGEGKEEKHGREGEGEGEEEEKENGKPAASRMDLSSSSEYIFSEKRNVRDQFATKGSQTASEA